jgi:CubicO group peptidase (beta-lactamase class C family)
MARLRILDKFRILSLILLLLAFGAAPLRAQSVVAPALGQSAAAPVHAQAPDLAGLDRYIEESRRAWGIPGLAIAIVKDDSVIFARGYGEREAGGGAAVDEHTLFAIASTTKAFTVAALGILVDEGVLEWDDPVRRHLPDFELGDPYVTRQVTIRDLLTHRVGVAREDNVWIAAPFDRPELVRRTRHLAQARGFREGYDYNNLMYVVAGEVVAAASGLSWNDFVETRLFAPRGMRRPTSRFATVQGRENVSGAHTGSGKQLVVMDRRDYDALGPAGSVFSSAREMAQWVKLHLNRGSYQGQRLLQEATLEEMHTPQVVMRIDSTTHRIFPTQNFSAYGLGWRLEDYHGRKIVQHTGSVNYTRTQVGLIPSAGIGVVVMANLSSSSLQTALMYRVFDLLLGLPPTDWSAEYLALAERSAARSAEGAARTKASRAEKTRPSLALESYAGTYTDPLYGEVTVAVEGGRLVLRYSPDYVADLEHWHHDTFQGRWRSRGFGESFVTFGLDARGWVRSLELEGFTVFRRTPR